MIDSILKLSAIEGHRYDDVFGVQLDDLTAYSGWHGDAVFAFHPAKQRFSEVFAEDIASDREDMLDSFKEGQRDVLEPDGLWSDVLEAMDAKTFWETFRSADPGLDAQGHAQKHWENNAGNLFSLQIIARYRAREDVGNVSGEDEIEVTAGLNGDYVLMQHDFLVRSITQVIPVAEPGRLLQAFAEVDRFFEELR